MPALKQMIKDNKVGLTVYYPDSARSRLWGNLDNMITESTGFQVGYRQWIHHDYNSLNRFYSDGSDSPSDSVVSTGDIIKQIDELPVENLQHGHMFTKMTLSGYSLLTIWQGDNAIERLLKLKGATHPAKAESGTIRGGFYCDNPISNLCHSSDDAQEVVREIEAVGLQEILNTELQGGQKLSPVATRNYMAHSGITIVCDVINRMLATMPDMNKLNYVLPASGNSRETMLSLIPILKTARTSLSVHLLSEFISGFLSGNIKTVSDKMKLLPVTKWEYFVVQCSTLYLNEWDEVL